jgi:hypothetical protein
VTAAVSLALIDGNLAVHPGLKVPRDEAGIFKLTTPSKLPQQFTRA